MSLVTSNIVLVAAQFIVRGSKDLRTQLYYAFL